MRVSNTQKLLLHFCQIHVSLYCDTTPEVTVFSVQPLVSFVAFETPVNVYSPKYITLRLQAINFLLPCSAEAVTVLILPCSAKVMYCLTKNFHVATNPYERFCLTHNFVRLHCERALAFVSSQSQYCKFKPIFDVPVITFTYTWMSVSQYISGS